MSTELTTTNHGGDLDAQIRFAQMVTAVPTTGRPGSSILPENYRENPANVLVAVGLGSSMGLSFAESLYRISVIKGKPSAAAELIASNVRRAGHKLRVKVTEEPPSATCTIIRADDPEEPTVVTRDMKWAERMGLAREPAYIKQPATMLSYRAITACARLACPEALYGVTYTPDEAADIPADPQLEVAKASSSDFLTPTPTTPALEQGAQEQAPQDITDAEVVTEDPPTDFNAMTGGPDFAPERNRLNAMFAEFTRAGFTVDARSAEGRKVRLDYCSGVLERPIASSSDLTAGEVERIIDALKVDAAEAALVADSTDA